MADSSLTRFTVKHAPIHPLTIAKLFAGLDEREKLYAHHMSRSESLFIMVAAQQALTVKQELHGMALELCSDRLHQKRLRSSTGSFRCITNAMVIGVI